MSHLLDPTSFENRSALYQSDYKFTNRRYGIPPNGQPTSPPGPDPMPDDHNVQPGKATLHRCYYSSLFLH